MTKNLVVTEDVFCRFVSIKNRWFLISDTSSKLPLVSRILPTLRSRPFRTRSGRTLFQDAFLFQDPHLVFCFHTLDGFVECNSLLFSQHMGNFCWQIFSHQQNFFKYMRFSISKFCAFDTLRELPLVSRILLQTPSESSSSELFPFVFMLLETKISFYKWNFITSSPTTNRPFRTRPLRNCFDLFFMLLENENQFL